MTKNNKEIWTSCDAVCFDVDSTVCTTEMIDELAVFCNVGEEVASWTRKAMGEGIPFQEALEARLQIIKPTKKIIDDFKEKDVSVFTEGVVDLITKLMEMKKDVYLLTGGFESLVRPIAAKLGIKESNIFANKILFDVEGNYCGFDINRPTSASGGKKVVMEKLKSDYGYKTMVMIGDGMTDLEAYPPADLFIGFGW